MTRIPEPANAANGSPGLTDPTHQENSPPVLWTTVNTAEAIPGVSTPLNWSFYRDAIEPGIRGCWVDLGVLPRGSEAIPADIGRCFAGMFYGQLATNLDQWRYVADRMPGTSGDAIEQQFFGTLRPGVSSETIYSRYPSAAVKAPLAAYRSAQKLRRLRSEVGGWWRRALERVDGGDSSQVLQDAAAFFTRSTRPHMTASMIASGVFEQITALANSAGQPGAELSLMTGMGQFEESRMLAALWDASRNRCTGDDVLRIHGYHGPAEGEISSFSWRENPAPMHALIDRYRVFSDTRDPRQKAEEQLRARRDAEHDLLAAISRATRPVARLLLKLAHTYLPLREVGRAIFLHTFDAGRAAARDLGRQMADKGILTEPDDAFFLTLPELAGEVPANAAELVAYRRERYKANHSITLPRAFTGNPEPVQSISVAEHADQLVTGTGVSPGIVEATARVITDQSQADDLEDGDILVCYTTDPSWASLFFVASAVVIDIGSAMSHGAIVARELGIPCVINTHNGTKAIPHGATVRVDGHLGTVEIF